MRTLTLATLVMAIATPAWALDGYQDRRGLYSALVFGGGLAKNSNTSEVGFDLGARIGGGISQRLTADLGIMYGAVPEADYKTLGFNIAANFFPIEMAFLRAGMGLSLLYPEVGDNKAGFGAVLGVGVEAFFGADLAGSFAITYEPQFYGDPAGTIHNVLGTVAISWY